MKPPAKIIAKPAVSLLPAEKRDATFENPNDAEEELFRFGQILFSRLALIEEDSKAWERVQNLRFRSMQVALGRAKFCAAKKSNQRRSWAKN